MTTATKAPVELIPVSTVVVGVRRRKSLGGLASLTRSIDAHGLFHPILVRNGHELVTGARRLEACRQLGWSTIPARRVDRLSDEELRAIEREENTERLDLLDYEASKARLAEIRQAEADAKASAELRPGPGRKSRGRPSEAGSERDVAQRTGVPRATRERLEKHVAVAEAYPFMQRPGWVQYRALEAGEKVAKLPEKERPAVATLLDQPGVPPKDAIKILDNLTGMKPAERQAIYEQAKDPDPHVRGQALTRAAALPPEPDPGLLLGLEAERTTRKAGAACRRSALAARYRAAADTLKAINDALKQGE